ncbi:hypothetical protein QV12_21050, partial [Pseudomonas putida]
MTSHAPAIVILGKGSLATARRLQQLYPDALIHGLAGRVEGTDRSYQDFGATLRQLYQQDTPIIALCAAGIVIRSPPRSGTTALPSSATASTGGSAAPPRRTPATPPTTQAGAPPGTGGGAARASTPA